MTAGENPLMTSEDLSFEAVLDRACSGLWDWKIRYSIRRLGEMETALLALERELDALVLKGGKVE
jgi:hypothetical protein